VAISRGSLSDLIVVARLFISRWSGVQTSVGSMSSRLPLLPPDLRTMLWNDLFSSLRSSAFRASSACSNWGSLTLSKTSLADSFLNAVAIWVQVALKRASTLSWSVEIESAHCQESWWMSMIT
jgi:hypothetical protein